MEKPPALLGTYLPALASAWIVIYGEPSRVLLTRRKPRGVFLCLRCFVRACPRKFAVMKCESGVYRPRWDHDRQSAPQAPA